MSDPAFARTSTSFLRPGSISPVRIIRSARRPSATHLAEDKFQALLLTRKDGHQQMLRRSETRMSYGVDVLWQPVIAGNAKDHGKWAPTTNWRRRKSTGRDFHQFHPNSTSRLRIYIESRADLTFEILQRWPAVTTSGIKLREAKRAGDTERSGG